MNSRFYSQFFVSACFAIALVFTLHDRDVVAIEYQIQFNCFGSGVGCESKLGGVHPGIDSSIYIKWQKWASLGAANGSQIPNYSGNTIRGLHVKIDGTNDTFGVPPGAGGKIFTDVWRKKDGKEVIFNTAPSGAGIKSGARLWSYVNPKTPKFPKPYFLGYASQNPIPVLSPEEWEQIPSTLPESKSSPFAILPDEYHDVRTYVKNSEGSWFLIVDNQLLKFDEANGSLYAVIYAHAIPAGFNRLEIEESEDGESEEYVVLKDDEELIRGDAINTPTIKLFPAN